MREYDLNRLLNDPEKLDAKIKDLKERGLLSEQDIDREEINGHIQKAEHNLRFVAYIAKESFQDWVLVGCYYACYHSALALIETKGYASKNHLATLCIIIKEFYDEKLSKNDIEVFSKFLDYEDVLFYVEAKNKREAATYSTKTSFAKNDVEKLRMQATMFVNKLKNIVVEYIS